MKVALKLRLNVNVDKASFQSIQRDFSLVLDSIGFTGGSIRTADSSNDFYISNNLLEITLSKREQKERSWNPLKKLYPIKDKGNLRSISSELSAMQFVVENETEASQNLLDLSSVRDDRADFAKHNTFLHMMPQDHSRSFECAQHSRLFEVIIPQSYCAQNNPLSNTEYFKSKSFPGIYKFDAPSYATNKDNSIYIRALPLKTVTLVIAVPNLSMMKESLSALKLSTPLALEPIGGRASYLDGSNSQLQVVSPLFLPSLDLRLAENPKLLPYFNEGSSTVLDGTIASIQSARVFGGGAHVREDKLDGDCWMEFRAMMKEKIRTLTGRSIA